MTERREQTRWDLTVVDEATVTPALDTAIRDLLIDAFPADRDFYLTSRAWHGSAPSWAVIALRDVKVAGHIGLIERDITVGAVRLHVAGIQNFAIQRSDRASGLGDALMGHALAHARSRGIRYGVLFCVPALAEYYGRSGWLVRDVCVRMDFEGQRDVEIPGKNVCMVHELGGDAFPPGDMHLCGPDW